MFLVLACHGSAICDGKKMLINKLFMNMIVIFFTLLQRSSIKNVPLLDGLFIYNKLVIKWVLLEQSAP